MDSPAIETFEVVRATGRAVIRPSLKLNADEPWVWTFHPSEPPEKVPRPLDPNNLEGLTQEDMLRGWRYADWEPSDVHLTLRQLLALLTPDEARLLMGYCAHLMEHANAHIAALAGALPEAKGQDGLDTITNELNAAGAIRRVAAAAAQAAYDSA